MYRSRWNAIALTEGARYMLGSALFFSVMSLFVKVAGSELPSHEIVFARGVVTTVLSYSMVRRAGLFPWGTRRAVLVFRGVIGFIALSCYYFSLTRLPIAEATVLQYTSPIWTALLAALLLREPATWRVVGASLLSFAGVAIMARPTFLFGELAARLDFVAVGVALFGALMSACAYVSVRELSKTEPALVIVFYFSLVTLLGPVPLVAPRAVWPSGVVWLALVGVGVATQIAQVFLTRGLTLVPAARAMTIAYAQILFAALWGVLFFAEYPDPWGIFGVVLVAAGTTAVGAGGGASIPPRVGSASPG